jgi:transcriptional regulator with XRE-family HTH domain
MEVRVKSNQIRLERENRGWSQEHLASVAGLSLRTIQRIERTGSASFESVTALASVFSVDVVDLRAGGSAPPAVRVIHLSLELPLRLALAALSGVLCALHFRWSYYHADSLSEIGFEWLDFVMAGALFAVAVLCPYLRPGPRQMVRALGLIGASALSYFCAVCCALMIRGAETWLPEDPGLIYFLFASLVGVAIVLVTARVLIPLHVTATFWLLGLLASLVGGAAMYVAVELFGGATLITVVGFCTWQMMACIAIHHGRQSKDAPGGILADFARVRGRFSIVPGWLRLRHPAPAQRSPVTIQPCSHRPFEPPSVRRWSGIFPMA